jgi:hypothetical protein
MRPYLLPLGLVAGVLAVVGAFVPILAAVGGVISILVFLLQHRASGPVVIAFTRDDFVRVGDGWQLRVPKKHHGRKNPSASAWRYAEHGWAQVIASPAADSDGDLVMRLKSGDPFDGQIRVI